MVLFRPGVKEDREPGQVGRLRRGGRWFMHSQGTLVASAMVLIAILAAGLYVLIVPADTDGPGEPARDQPGAAAPAPVDDQKFPVADPAVNLCPEQPAKGVAPETLVLAAYSTSWVVENGWLVPQSTDAGPAVATHPRACFARTPEGALYSLATFFTESLAAVSTDEQIRLVQARAARTGSYEQMMQEVAKDPSLVEVTGQPTVRITGYRWLGYTPDMAQIELQFLRLTGPRAGASVRMTVDAVWETNDWLVVVPNENTQIYRPGNTQTVFTPWGPPA